MDKKETTKNNKGKCISCFYCKQLIYENKLTTACSVYGKTLDNISIKNTCDSFLSYSYVFDLINDTINLLYGVEYE